MKKKVRRMRSLSVRVSEFELGELMKLARAKDVPGAQVVREAIRRAIYEYKE